MKLARTIAYVLLSTYVEMMSASVLHSANVKVRDEVMEYFLISYPSLKTVFVTEYNIINLDVNAENLIKCS